MRVPVVSACHIGTLTIICAGCRRGARNVVSAMSPMRRVCESRSSRGNC